MPRISINEGRPSLPGFDEGNPIVGNGAARVSAYDEGGAVGAGDWSYSIEPNRLVDAHGVTGGPGESSHADIQFDLAWTREPVDIELKIGGTVKGERAEPGYAYFRTDPTETFGVRVAPGMDERVRITRAQLAKAVAQDLVMLLGSSWERPNAAAVRFTPPGSRTRGLTWKAPVNPHWAKPDAEVLPYNPFSLCVRPAFSGLYGLPDWQSVVGARSNERQLRRRREFVEATFSRFLAAVGDTLTEAERRSFDRSPFAPLFQDVEQIKADARRHAARRNREPVTLAIPPVSEPQVIWKSEPQDDHIRAELAELKRLVMQLLERGAA